MTIKNSITRKIGNQKLAFRRQSPHIFFVSGIVGIVGSTVLACRATLKLEKTLEGIQEDLHDLTAKRDENNPNDDIPRRQDVAYVYTKGSLALVKLYGPSIVVGGVSIAALTGSHMQLTRRNTALTVAYTGLHRAYNEYRDRIREHLGDEAEKDLYHGVKLEEVKGEDGKKKLVKVVDPNGLSVYARFFDESSTQWTKDPEVNRLFVQCQQNYANHLLQARGHVFLNEVYDSLGIERSRAGQVVGWTIGEDGDNFIDFGLFDCESSRFINGIEKSILLDFNVDGPVLDKF